MRVLVIPFEHVPEIYPSEYSMESAEWHLVLRRCLQIALIVAAELWDKRDFYVVGFDWDHHTFKDHYHLQVCLKELGS